MDRIGVFDSGIGGLTTMAEIANYLNGGDFIYLADDVHAPFGAKTESELYDLGYCGMKTLVQLGCNHVVLGCNTLTANVKRALEKEFKNVNVIGTEPAVTPALKENLNVALLATPATISSERLRELITPYSGRIVCYPNPNLAGVIERIAPDYSIVEEYLTNSCAYLNNHDSVVLGCTHFVHVKHVFKKVFPQIMIYDGNFGVAKRVASFVKSHENPPKFQIFTTIRGEELRYRKIFNDFYKKIKNGY